MKKFKHLSPELQEQYKHWFGEYMRQTDKKRITLFVIWFVVLVGINIVNFTVEPKNLVISVVMLVWSLLGLTVTLIDYNKRMAFIEAHVFEKEIDAAKKANEEK